MVLCITHCAPHLSTTRSMRPSEGAAIVTPEILSAVVIAQSAASEGTRDGVKAELFVRQLVKGEGLACLLAASAIVARCLWLPLCKA